MKAKMKTGRDFDGGEKQLKLTHHHCYPHRKNKKPAPEEEAAEEENHEDMSEDEWVRVAMSDDALVVQLLLELHRAEEEKPPPLPPMSLLADAQPPLKWTVRQPRSKQLQQRKKSSSSARASPTTPLSWSGGTSTASGCGGGGGVGGGGGGLAEAAAGDGCEESSSVPAGRGGGETSRSAKVCSGFSLLPPVFGAGEFDSVALGVGVASGTPTTKRSRKKKTLAELREEESLLFEERRNLKHQLGALRMNLERQRSANENLKRMKLELLSRQMPNVVTVSAKCEDANFVQHQKIHVASDAKIPISTVLSAPQSSAPDVSFQLKGEDAMEPAFMLPDLNLPVENDSSPDGLYGLS
ncbi:hypothetical protein Tsubulata_003017 [Turnera subulata]|uniref:Uncharacterized protein n=1 Tax=Turnera subulata TaxID=218843 RepID=A0A9Q0G3Y1_9ROSI|nr:hypothetical protein Tsubulata_003017 [Turnera subulata]